MLPNDAVIRYPATPGPNSLRQSRAKKACVGIGSTQFAGTRTPQDCLTPDPRLSDLVSALLLTAIGGTPIAAVCRNYRIDLNRIVLRRSSLGGVGTWQLEAARVCRGGQSLRAYLVSESCRGAGSCLRRGVVGEGSGA